jgi:USP6 N-terminal-like protein
LTRNDNPNETKLRALEKEREKKWVKMLKKWKYIESANQKLQPDDKPKQAKGSSSNKLKESVEDKEKLSKRIHKGIPDKLRHLVWKKLLNIDKLMADNQGVYARMLKLARKYSPDVRQIDFDVNRQFREHLFYMERYSTKQKSLFNVLTAYSMYNSEVGYCQGMATVCGVLLMYMDEEESFWAMHRLLADPKYAMHGLYIEGFPKLMRFIAHHDKIITKFMPKLKRHFDKNGLDAILYSLKWFFVIFVERIPFSLCLRVWDLYFLEGERVITATAFTILRLHRNKLLKLKDMDLLTEYLQVQLHKQFGYDDDHMIKTLEISMADLKRVKLDLPPAAQANEFAKNKFGDFVEPDFETKIGRRHTIFSDAEREVTENCMMTR